MTSNIFILTAILWLVFCYWWFSYNHASMHREPFGHLMSPFVFGFVGLILAGLTFGYFSYRQRKVQENGEKN